MKKLLSVIVLTLAVAAMASAEWAQPDWGFGILADNGFGRNSMAQLIVGVQSGCKDGFGVDGTASDDYDARPLWFITNNTRGVLSVEGTKAWVKDTKSARSPLDPAYNAGQTGPNASTYAAYPYEANCKIWDLSVFSVELDYRNESNIIRLQFRTHVDHQLPTATVPDPTNGGTPRAFAYRLRMVDNKGVVGAPANGTSWDIPIPTSYSANAYFTLTLPIAEAFDKGDYGAINEGYRMQFIQTVVPEPGGFMALAGGLMGLAGFSLRRRR